MSMKSKPLPDDLRATYEALQVELEAQRGAQQRLAVQYAVVRVLAEAVTLQEGAPHILQAIAESLNWDAGGLWLKDESANVLRCAAFWHKPEIPIEEFANVSRNRTFLTGVGLPGRVWATGKPAWVPDVVKDPHFPRAASAASAGLHAAFGFPIKLEEELCGVLEFFSQEILEPDHDLLQMFDVVGIQIGQFIERRSGHQALDHERFLLRTLMDNLPDPIYFKDRLSRFLRNNRAHLKCFGLTDPEQAIGKTDFDFFGEEHARQAYEDEQEMIRTGQGLTKEEKETWQDGRVTWALSTKMPLRNPRGEIVGTFGISRDITDRKRAEEALRKAKEAAEEANRTKSQFLANMSHELRTPLNSVIGFANILLKNKANNLRPEDLTFLERILANGKHLLGLINEILDLSKIEARKVELAVRPVALDELVRETVAQQEGQVRLKPVKLVAQLPPRIAALQTDPQRLKQVIINLIGNALKFTEQGSVTVSVVTDPASGEPSRIDVTDTGIGIPQDRLGVIFEAFQQADASTSRKYGGTGLGLTISQALCQLMGYRIEVSSQVGVGSTFSILLNPGGVATQQPAAPTKTLTASVPSPEPTRETAVAAVSVNLKSKSVLIIDDEEDSRVLLTHTMEEAGCRVIGARSAQEGLSLARSAHPDLISVDLLMPGMSGWDLVSRLKADPELRSIPVIVVSVIASENTGRVFGAVDVLQKPISRDELLAVLHRNLCEPRPRILVVDDDPDVRRILVSYLEEGQAEVRTAANGREGLERVQETLPDLILLDLIMPVMDGMAFLHALRLDPRCQNIPVAVITSKDLTPEETQRLKHETLEVVTKADVFSGELKRLLQRILQRAELAPVAGRTVEKVSG
jgi:PAS domain S-box-containing protein